MPPSPAMISSPFLPLLFLLLAACTPVTRPVQVDLLIVKGTVFTGEDTPPQILDIGIRGDTIAFVGTDGGGPLRTAEALAFFDAQGVGTNVALFAGHGSIRGEVLGMAARAPNAAELERMKQWVRTAMEAGALGLSTGLYYAPGSFAETEEVIELAKVAAQYGGIYESHIRDESSYTVGLIGAVEEVLRIGREAQIPVHIAHIKALGVDVWGKSEGVIAQIETAQAEGIRVTADQYPYRASGTGIAAALVPRWVMEDSREAQRQRLTDPKLLPRIREEMQENLRKRGGPESMLITGAGDPALPGKHLGEVAAAWQLNPIEAAIRITLAGGASVASFNMQESDITRFMQQPWVMTCSDGSDGHPRKYGTYPQKFQQYVRAASVISPETFVHRSSRLVAETFGIARRGSLKAGFFADVIVFDPGQFRANATFEAPERLASGMKHVFVNGKQAVTDGAFTGVLAGKALRREPM